MGIFGRRRDSDQERAENEERQRATQAARAEEEAAAALTEAIALEEAGNREAADASLRQAYELGNDEVAYRVGLLLGSEGEFEDAEAAFARADEAGEALGSFERGRLMEMRGDTEGAEAAYRRAEERGFTGAAIMSSDPLAAVTAVRISYALPISQTPTCRRSLAEKLGPARSIEGFLDRGADLRAAGGGEVGEHGAR